MAVAATASAKVLSCFQPRWSLPETRGRCDERRPLLSCLQVLVEWLRDNPDGIRACSRTLRCCGVHSDPPVWLVPFKFRSKSTWILTYNLHIVVTCGTKIAPLASQLVSTIELKTLPQVNPSKTMQKKLTSQFTARKVLLWQPLIQSPTLKH